MMERQTPESGSRIISSTYIWLEEMILTPLNIYPLSLKGQPGTGLKAFPKTQLEVGKSSKTLSEQIFKGPTSVPGRRRPQSHNSAIRRISSAVLEQISH